MEELGRPCYGGCWSGGRFADETGKGQKQMRHPAPVKMLGMNLWS